jgi:hypothetical protein
MSGTLKQTNLQLANDSGHHADSSRIAARKRSFSVWVP